MRTSANVALAVSGDGGVQVVPRLPDELAVHGEMPQGASGFTGVQGGVVVGHPRRVVGRVSPAELLVGHAHGGDCVLYVTELGQGVGANGVQHGLFGGRQPVGAHQRQLGERQRGVGVAAADRLTCLLYTSSEPTRPY